MGRHAWLFCAVATRAGLLELGGQLGLELLEREGAESPWAGVNMRDADGKAFVCRSGSPAAREPEPGPKTLSEALGQLDGSCAYLNQGWWTYEWCHRRHVRQFHLEAQARSPEWSLGDYTRTELEDDDGGAASSVDAAGSEALSRAVDVFDVGGQRCDETGTGRSSTVHFRCCDGPKPGKATKGKRKRAAGAEAFITSVDEVALCSYAFAVCSPSLCSPSSPNATASLLLKALEGVCLQRHEGWWSFEFCYKKGARQFHARLPRVETTPPPAAPELFGVAQVDGMGLGLGVAGLGLEAETTTVPQVETRDNGEGRKLAHVAAEFSLGDAAPDAGRRAKPRPFSWVSRSAPALSF